MDFGLDTGAAYMRVLEDWQGSVATNLSASSNTGFKGRTFAVEGTDPRPSGSRAPRSGDISLPQSRTVRNYAVGESRPTGNPLDMAVQGGGFFALLTPEGETVYTRDGSFLRNAEGTLVSKQGYTVVGEEGPLTLPLEDGPLAILPDGTITQNDQKSGRIPLFEFAEPAKLEERGNHHFSDPENEAGLRPATGSKILQGYLESSNVEPLKEMVNMIAISRSYEAAQKLITTVDELKGKAIQTLGNPA